MNGYKLYNLTVRNGPTKKTVGKDTSSTIRRYKTVINEATITENNNNKKQTNKKTLKVMRENKTK